eukprot:g8435.t1
MESRQGEAGVSHLPLANANLTTCSRISKSEVSSLESSNNLLETDSDEGQVQVLSISPSSIWKETPSECKSGINYHPPGPPTYIAKDARSLTVQWEQSKPANEDEIGTYSVQMQRIDLPSGLSTPDGGTARTLIDMEAWEVVYCGMECWTQIKGLRPGRYYAIQIKCDWTFNEEMNSVVSSVAVLHTTPTTPDAPQPPALIGIQHSSMRLNWTDPVEDGGSDINEFQLQLRHCSSSQSEEDFLDVYNGLERSFTVTELEPFTKYNVRVKAKNEVGESPWSVCSSFKTKAKAPEAPQELTGRFLTPSVILLNWKPLQQHCRNQITYELEIENLKTGFRSSLETGFESNHKLSAIEHETEFKFRVRGINEIGVGEWSHPFSILPSPMPPGAPSCPVIVSCFQTEASFFWEPPETSDNHPVNLYKAEMILIDPETIKGDYTQFWGVAYEGSQNNCIVKELIPGCDYRIRLKAKNEAGWSAPSLILQFHTRSGVPMTSGIPYTIERSSQSMELYWLIPDHDGGKPITHYRLEACPVSDLKLNEEDLEIEPFKEVYRGIENRTNVKDLIPETVYAFRVQSMNEIGVSPWSEIGYESTKTGPPKAPEKLEIAQYELNSVQLSWTGSRIGDGSNTDYSVVLRRLSSSHSDALELSTEVYKGPLTKCVISNLKLASNYELKIKAINVHGSSPWSSAFYLNTSAVLPQEAIADLSAEEVKNTRVKLSWTDQTMNKNTIFIVEVKSTIVSMKNVEWKECWRGTESHCLIEKLMPLTEYTFRVFDESQGQLTSKLISLQTCMGPPSTPRNLKINQITSSSLRVEWDVPDSITFKEKSHSSSFHYIIQAKKRSESSDHVLQTLTTSREFMKVGGLEPNVEYEIQVAAESENGVSQWSEKVQSKTKLAPPLPPVEIQTELVDTGLEVNLKVAWSCVKGCLNSQIPQKFDIEVYGVSGSGSKKSKNSQNLFAKISVSKTNSCTCFNLHRNQKYELRIRGISSSGSSGRWSKPVKFDTVGLAINEAQIKLKEPFSIDIKELPDNAARVDEEDILTTMSQPRRIRKGQVSIPQKRTNPLKRRKSFWKQLLRSYTAPMILLSLFFLAFLLLYLNPSN